MYYESERQPVNYSYVRQLQYKPSQQMHYNENYIQASKNVIEIIPKTFDEFDKQSREYEEKIKKIQEDHREIVQGLTLRLDEKIRELYDLQRENSELIHIKNISSSQVVEQAHLIQNLQNQLKSKEIQIQELLGAVVQRQEVKPEKKPIQDKTQNERNERLMEQLEKLLMNEDRLQTIINQKDRELSTLTKQIQNLQEVESRNLINFHPDKEKQYQLQNKLDKLPYIAEVNNNSYLIINYLQSEELREQNKDLKNQLHHTNDKLQQSEQNFREKNEQVMSLKRRIREFELIQEKKMEAWELKQEEEKINNIDDGMLDGILSILSYLRETIVNDMFDVFVRSANSAFQRKANSLTLFAISIDDLRITAEQGLLSLLYLYRKMKQLIKIYYKSYGKVILQENEGNDQNKFRDNSNKWVEQSLAKIKQQYKQEEKSKQKDLMNLFRILSVKYRILYPLRGTIYRFKVDDDLKIRLEDKICSTMLNLFIEEL